MSGRSGALEVEGRDGSRDLRDLARGAVDVALEERQVEVAAELTGPPARGVTHRPDHRGRGGVVRGGDPAAPGGAGAPAARPGGGVRPGGPDAPRKAALLPGERIGHRTAI